MKENNFVKNSIYSDILNEIQTKSNKFPFYKYFSKQEISHKDGQEYYIIDLT